jgi:molecular chaperone DnaK (HSP70)
MINIKKTKIYLEINSLDKRTETNETSSKTENKDNLEKVINAFKHVVSSEEWQEMENAIKDLTKEQKEKVEKFINTEIKPAL